MLESMRTYSLWLLEQLPAFLQAEPICYFVGVMFAGTCIGLLRQLMRISR